MSMIGDDMPIFLEYLRGCIDWNAYGFEICCEAHDGREALQKMAEYYPDVVLTDITMPYLNGLELSEQIIRDYPDTSVVLITGNNEFEYARKAVKIGVCDYIVKPFEKEELILSLLKLQDNISKAVENTLPGENDVVSDELKALIYAGVQDSENDNELRNRIFGSDNRPSDPGYLLGTVKLNTAKTSAGQMSENTRENLMNWGCLIAKLLGDKIEIDGEFRIFNDFENNIVVLMEFNDPMEAENYKGYEFADIINVVKNQLEFDISIAISLADSLRNVKRAYEKVLGTVSSEKSVGQFTDLRINPETEIYSSIDAIFRLNKDIENLQLQDAEDAINSIWSKFRSVDEGKSGINNMNILSSIVSVLMTNIINSGFSIEKIYGEGFSPENFFADSKDLTDMKDKVIYLFQKRIEFESGKKGDKTHDVAESARKYIEENYGNSQLNISEISEKICVNQTYLRKMFKAEMDMTLTEYITQFRMQRAKHLITTTDEKLATIAEMVGYSDVSYFSNVFKKYFGIAPRSMGRQA